MSAVYRIGLIGRNISYSKSGAIYEAICAQFDAGCEFELLDRSPGDLDTLVYALRKGRFDGVAVTVPHKSAMLSFLDRKDELVQILGAVNSIAVQGSSLNGYNTDSHGFAEGLRRGTDLRRFERALIFGNGGSARSVVHSLYRNFNVRNVVIVGRAHPRLQKFKTEFLDMFTDLDAELVTGDQPYKNAGVFDIAVNCTPLGGFNHPDESPQPSWFAWPQTRLYYDLNYNSTNRVMASAEDMDVEVLDGSGMLVAQAVESFRLWTGKAATPEAVYQAVFPGQ